MKPTTPYTDGQRYAGEQRPVWLLRLDFAGQPWLAASRAITFGGDTYPGRIAEAPAWRMEAAGEFGPGGAVTTRARVRVADVLGGADSLHARLDELQPLGVGARLLLLWDDGQGGWVEADAAVMLDGAVADWSGDATGIELELRDRLSAAGSRRIGRILVPEMTGGQATPLLGEMLPIVIGRHDALRLAELRPGASTRLAEALAPGETIVKVASVAGFPFSGSAQIGAEVIAYSALDLAGATLGTAAQPVVRGQSAALHSRGEPVRSAPPGGFQWLVADHPCVSVTDVQADGAPVPAGDWTAETRALGSVQAQVVTMAKWPVRERFSTIRREENASALGGAGAYSIAAGNTASQPELAIDGKLTSTAATLGLGGNLLAVAIGRSVGSEGRMAGRWGGASIWMRYSATRGWSSGSRLRVRLRLDAAFFDAVVPRPGGDETGGTVENEPGTDETPVETPVGIHEFKFDLSEAIGAAGWDALDTATPVEIQARFDQADLEGNPVQVFVHDLQLRVSAFPRLASEEARAITARVEGWDDGGGQPVENPADVIELLVTGERFGGLGAGAIDAASLTAARNLLQAEGFAFARVLSGGPRLIALLQEAAREAAVWVRFGGDLVRFQTATVFPSSAASIERLDETRALEAGTRARLRAPEGEALADCFALARPAAGGNPGAVWSQCREGTQGEGSIPLRRRLAWLDGRSADALAYLGERSRRQSQEPTVVHRQAFPLGAALLEPGDPVTGHNAALGLLDWAAWVETVATEGGGRVAIQMRGPLANEFCWIHDAQTYIRRLGGGERLVIYLAGSAIASVERAGDLRLAGRVREAASIAAGPFGGAVTFDAGFLYWSTGTGGTFTPFARLDAQGNLDLTGALREDSALAFTTGAACAQADATQMSLTPEAERGALEYRVAQGVLHLAGRLTEGIGI